MLIEESIFFFKKVFKWQSDVNKNCRKLLWSCRFWFLLFFAIATNFKSTVFVCSVEFNFLDIFKEDIASVLNKFGVTRGRYNTPMQSEFDLKSIWFSEILRFVHKTSADRVYYRLSRCWDIRGCFTFFSSLKFQSFKLFCLVEMWEDWNIGKIVFFRSHLADCKRNMWGCENASLNFLFRGFLFFFFYFLLFFILHYL
jgi:hypothetical protein